MQALGLPPIAKVAAGHYHSLALALDGSVWAWGQAIAVAGAQTPILPVKINLSGRFVDIAASDGFSVALRDDGTVWAWGLNNAGELGRGTISGGASDSIPAQVIGLANIGSISVSNNLSINHTLAVKTDGSVWAWGGNALGQLGDGTTVNRPTPFMVNGLAGVTEVRAAFSRSFARLTNGTIYTWGNNVVIGGVAWSGSQFGGSLTPQAVIQGSPLMSVFSPTMPFVIADGTGATSNAFALFISPFAGGLNVNAGLVMGAGANADGVLGNGTTTDAPSAVSASGIDQVASLTTSGRHVVAVKRDGSVWAWGFNSEGQLGDGTTVTRLVPTRVPGLTL